MATYAEERLTVSTVAAEGSHDGRHRVIYLLDAALHRLHGVENIAHGTILKAEAHLWPITARLSGTTPHRTPSSWRRARRPFEPLPSLRETYRYRKPIVSARETA